MQDAGGEFHVFLVNQDGNFDFGGGNHLDVDALRTNDVIRTEVWSS